MAQNKYLFCCPGESQLILLSHIYYSIIGHVVECYQNAVISRCLGSRLRAAKFGLKVDSWRTTKIKILVALILLPYYMYVVLVLIMLFLLVRER